MKLATLTYDLHELQELVPLMRELYFRGEFELISFVNTQAEASANSLLSVHRRLREYLNTPAEPGVVLQGDMLSEACRNALLEERPDLVLWPSRSRLKEIVHPLAEQFGIVEVQLSSGDELNLEKTLARLKASECAAHSPRVSAQSILALHWEALGKLLESPCLLLTSDALAKACRERFPDLEFHREPSGTTYPCGLSLFDACYSDTLKERYRVLVESCTHALSLEPVNTPVVDGRFCLRYGGYDNEFALYQAERDLRLCFPPKHHTEVWGGRKGQGGPYPLPNPDGKHPLFVTRWPATEVDWTQRYALPAEEKLRVVFADSGNVAGSALHHADAVNRFTQSSAWAVTGAPHPFIGPPKSDEYTIFLNQNPAPSHLEEVLTSADCVVFFEDDDEESSAWTFPMREYIRNAAIVHLYIGYRVHAKTPKLTRPERLILTPLPHLLKMYPEAEFYAGFVPHLEEAEEEIEPLSSEDGICRFLHTPSLPHWTTSRYPYHKDTEAFFRAARSLKAKYGPKVEFHQVGGWSHKEVVAARQACDVTFNQLRGFHGLSGDEAMMLGRPCVQAFDRINLNRHHEYWGLAADFPWLTCHREDLEHTFERLLLDPDLRREIGGRSREFMRKYFSPRKGILPLLFHCYRAKRGRLRGRV